jgi:dihydrofolate synthase/folylpolyglutamate synthase
MTHTTPPASLEDWLEWQQRLHPSAMQLGLERVASVWRRLVPDGLRFPVITIAGTNGKGSCGAMLEAIYHAAGFRTAWYSSPHLLRYNERVRLDGREVEDDVLCEAFARIEGAREASALTYFEFGTLAALDIFVRADPEVAILEVGLGGRLDAVNLVDPDVAVVTTIARDHWAILGDSLEQIAFEKAGIFRAGRPAIVGHRTANRSLLARAAELGCGLHRLGQEFDWEHEGAGWRWRGRGAAPIALPSPALRGEFQYDNASAALMAVACLTGRLPVGLAALRLGTQGARLRGRFEVIPGEVSWILDVAHNAQAAEALAVNLGAFRCAGRVHAVLGVLRDRDPAAIVGPVAPLIASWHLGQAADARSLPTEELRTALEGSLAGRAVADYPTIEAALEGAAQTARAGDCILVFGSFTTVEAAARRTTGGNPI